MELHFFGDLSLNSLYCDPQQHPRIEENMVWLDKSLGKSDLKIVNWEAPIWGDSTSINKDKEQLNYPMLCTTNEASESILPLNIGLALLANNHIYDCGYKGIYNTTNFFTKHNISYIGIGTENKKCQPFFFKKGGVDICILNYAGEETHPHIPNNSTIKLSFIDPEEILSDINNYKERVDHLIVTLHWGKDELTRVPSVAQRKLARLLIDSGASVVLGSHVHCLQGWEEYNDGLIIYSLGNFLFGPILGFPGKFYSLPTIDSNKIGVAKITLSKHDVSLHWSYFLKDKNSLLLEKDDGRVSYFHKKLNATLELSDKKLARRYNIEVIISVIRSYIDKNGGILKSLLSLERRHFLLIIKNI